MSSLEELQPQTAVRGILADSLVTVVNVQWFGTDALELTYKDPGGKVANTLLYRNDESRLEVIEQGRPWSFDGDGHLFRLVSEHTDSRVIELLTKSGRPPTERELSEETGLRRGLLRRCRLLMELPPKYREDLLDELNKPKSQQKLTEDFFIEMERALTTVNRALPTVIQDKNRVRDVLISKYKAGIIKNITDFRSLAKIARAEKVSADAKTATAVIREVFHKNEYSIEQAYNDSVSEAYSERDLIARIEGLVEKLEELVPSSIDSALRSALEQLYKNNPKSSTGDELRIPAAKPRDDGRCCRSILQGQSWDRHVSR